MIEEMAEQSFIVQSRHRFGRRLLTFLENASEAILHSILLAMFSATSNVFF